MRLPKGLVAVLAAGLVLSACSGKSTSTTTATGQNASGTDGPHKPGGTVTIANTTGQTWPCQFNPFNPAQNQEALGFVYEPLVHVSVVGNSKETPMLATGYKWSDDLKSIVFTIRDGVKWSDGQAFSADDVAYTFNLMKQHPALDLFALWTGAGLSGVTASGNQVTMTFSKAAKPYFGPGAPGPAYDIDLVASTNSHRSRSVSVSNSRISSWSWRINAWRSM